MTRAPMSRPPRLRIPVLRCPRLHGVRGAPWECRCGRHGRRFLQIARRAIARHEGAEIKTEGDVLTPCSRRHRVPRCADWRSSRPPRSRMHGNRPAAPGLGWRPRRRGGRDCHGSEAVRPRAGGWCAMSTSVPAMRSGRRRRAVQAATVDVGDEVVINRSSTDRTEKRPRSRIEDLLVVGGDDSVGFEPARRRGRRPRRGKPPTPGRAPDPRRLGGGWSNRPCQTATSPPIMMTFRC